MADRQFFAQEGVDYSHFIPEPANSIDTASWRELINDTLKSDGTLEGSFNDFLT